MIGSNLDKIRPGQFQFILYKNNKILILFIQNNTDMGLSQFFFIQNKTQAGYNNITWMA